MRREIAKRLPELDGMRGLAITSVLLWHYFVLSIDAPAGSMLAYAQKALSLSWAGVDLFFVLSGYLIGGILLDQRDAATFCRPFFARRAARILPLYVVVLVAFPLVRRLVGGTSNASLDWLFSNPFPGWAYVAYVQNFFAAARSGFGAGWLSPTWSLAVEEHFYLLLPLLVRFVPRSRLPLALAALVVTAPVFRAWLYLSSPGGGLAGHVLLPGRWDALFLGVLGAWAVRLVALRSWLEAHARFLWGVEGVCALALAVLLDRGQGIASAGMSYFGHTALALGALTLILLTSVCSGGILRRALSVAPLVWLGTVSYGVYLLHTPVLGLTEAWLRDSNRHGLISAQLVIPGVAFAITCGLSALSWRYFERPCVALGRRIKYE